MTEVTSGVPGARVVIVGPLAHLDETIFGVPQEGWGGPAPVAARALARLGEPPLLVTRLGRKHRDRVYLTALRDAGVQLIVQWEQAAYTVRRTFPDLRTADFYTDRIIRRSEPFDVAELARVFGRRPAWVALAPLARDDLPVTAVQHAVDAGAQVALYPRGFLRRISRRGNVYPDPWPDRDAVLPHVGLLVLTHAEAQVLLEADAGDAATAATAIAQRFGCARVYVTTGRHGSAVATSAGATVAIPAYAPAATFVSSGGCGAVYFAGALYGALHDMDAAAAGHFAAMCAGVCVGRAAPDPGTAGEVAAHLRAAAAAGSAA